jgi:hypothetical protein
LVFILGSMNENQVQDAFKSIGLDVDLILCITYSTWT